MYLQVVKKLIAIFILLASSTAFAQYVEEPDSAEIHLFIKNPTDHDITILAFERNNPFVYSKITSISKKDSSELSFVAELRVDRVPQDRYQFKIYESNYYYEINDHYYWDCERIEGETYKCTHVIKEYIQIDTTKQFDSLTYRQEELKNMPFLDSRQVEELPAYPGDISQMMKDIDKELDFSSAKEDVRIYFEVIIDQYGKVRNAYPVKSSHPEFDAEIKEFFESKIFKPARNEGKNVATKIVYPIRMDVKK